MIVDDCYSDSMCRKTLAQPIFKLNVSKLRGYFSSNQVMKYGHIDTQPLRLACLADLPAQIHLYSYVYETVTYEMFTQMHMHSSSCSLKVSLHSTRASSSTCSYQPIISTRRWASGSLSSSAGRWYVSPYTCEMTLKSIHTCVNNVTFVLIILIML